MNRRLTALLRNTAIVGAVTVALGACTAAEEPEDEATGVFQVHNRTDEVFVAVALGTKDGADDFRYLPSTSDVSFAAPGCVGTGALLLDQRRRVAARLDQPLCGGAVWQVEADGSTRLLGPGEAERQLAGVTSPSTREPYPSPAPWTTPSP